MADKKFRTGVDFKSTVKVSSETANRALTLDGSGNLTSSSVTDTELGYLSGVSSAIQTQLDAKVDDSEKGSANGVATLDGAGKLPSSQLPTSAMEYKGAHNVSTNSPSLADGAGDNGDMYRISVGGSRDYGSGSITLAAGDALIYNGSIWEKIPGEDLVQSVNGNQGIVVLDADDIDDSSTTNKYVTAADVTKLGHISVTQAVDLDTLESDTATNSSKLSGIESGATADQTGAEIKAAYEGEADTNAFTDAEKTLLGNQSGTNTGDEAAASQSVAGIAEVATVAEIDAQTDDTRMISPLGLAGSALQTKVDGIESGATADQTGAEIKAAYEGEADTNAFTDAEQTKLSGIESGADVTDATNVDAAGATMNTDTDVSSNSWVLDEDNMASDDATKVPTQQSVKAYVDSQVSSGGNLSSGDIQETSFAASNNVASAADVTGLAFANGTVRSFLAIVSVTIDATADLYEVYTLTGVQKGASWDMAIESVGDESNITFSITTAGQVQYTSGNEAGFVSNTMKFRADTTSV